MTLIYIAVFLISSRFIFNYFLYKTQDKKINTNFEYSIEFVLNLMLICGAFIYFSDTINPYILIIGIFCFLLSTYINTLCFKDYHFQLNAMDNCFKNEFIKNMGIYTKHRHPQIIGNILYFLSLATILGCKNYLFWIFLFIAIIYKIGICYIEDKNIKTIENYENYKKQSFFI